MDNLTSLGQRVVEFLTVLSVIGTGTWFILEPRAEDFVRTTVDGRISSIEDTLKKLDDKANGLFNKQHDEELSSARAESDLATLKDVQKQMLKILLKSPTP